MDPIMLAHNFRNIRSQVALRAQCQRQAVFSRLNNIGHAKRGLRQRFEMLGKNGKLGSVRGEWRESLAKRVQLLSVANGRQRMSVSCRLLVCCCDQCVYYVAS